MTTQEKSIIERLNKLIAHEQSARSIGSIAEAETFAAKIQELLFRHKLEMTDIEVEAEDDQPIDREFLSEINLTGKDRKQHLSWVGILLNAVGSANFCRVIGHHAGGYHLIGKPTDRETAKALFHYLYRACLEVAPLQAELHVGNTYAKRGFISGFKLGFASAISKRIGVEQAKLRASAQERGLIRIDQLSKQVDAKVKELFPELRKGSACSTRSHAGYQAGQLYGSAVGINGTKRLS